MGEVILFCQQKKKSFPSFCWVLASPFLSLNPLFTRLRFPLILSFIFQPYLELRHLHNVLRVERNVKTCLSLTELL